MANKKVKKGSPSIDEWLKDAKTDPAAAKVGMFLVHNGVVRQTPKATVCYGFNDGTLVTGMELFCDETKVCAAIAETYNMDGIFYIKVWINEGYLNVGDDIMYVLIGGDIRAHVVSALKFLVEKIKTECITEKEHNT